MSELVFAAIMCHLSGCSTRNSLNQNRDWEEFRINYERLLGLRSPHMDTVNAVLEKIPPEQFSQILYHLVNILLQKRVMHKFKLMDQYFIVAIDGTGIFTFDNEPYGGCPYKTSKKGKVTYSQSIVEAKIICANGLSVSIGTEWILNEDGANKQDCEYKATLRLLEKLKKQYPRLPMCMVMDGLFLKYPIQNQIRQYNWEFIMVWKDKTKYKLQDEITKRRDDNALITKTYTEFPNSCTREEYVLEYSDNPLMQKDIKVWYLKGEKTKISIKPEVEQEYTKFVFMTSLKVNSTSVKALFEGGRLRWKIENEGFNEQKNGTLRMHHKMNRNNLFAMKNFYICLQIAHLLMQLISRAKNSITKLYETKKMIWEDLCALLRLLQDYRQKPLQPRYNLRY
jgi:hypothetical protein